MSGIKHDQNKPKLSFVSREMMEALARVREFGAGKYARDNWKNGFNYTRSIDALLRHVFAFLSGEDKDPESGLNHIHHAACNIEHLIYDIAHHPENDDRLLTNNSLKTNLGKYEIHNFHPSQPSVANVFIERTIPYTGLRPGEPRGVGTSNRETDDGTGNPASGAV